MRAFIFSVLALMLLAACSGPSADFADMRALDGNGPDPSGFRLNEPLVLPPANTLPPPTPGGVNRADPR